MMLSMTSIVVVYLSAEYTLTYAYTSTHTQLCKQWKSQASVSNSVGVLFSMDAFKVEHSHNLPTHVHMHAHMITKHEYIHTIMTANIACDSL